MVACIFFGKVDKGMLIHGGAMTGIYLGGIAGGDQFAETLQTTKDRLRKRLDELANELKDPANCNHDDGVNISRQLHTELTAIGREINTAEFQISKLQIAEGTLEIMDEKVSKLKEIARKIAESPELTKQDIAKLEKEAEKLISSYNATIESTLFAGHELLNGGDGSVVTIDRLKGIDLSSRKAASDSLKILDEKADELKKIRKELEEMRTNQLQATVTTLQVTMQNVNALQASVIDAESAVENARLLNEQLHKQAADAMTAHGNLSSVRVLQLIT
jgi:flagellin